MGGLPKLNFDVKPVHVFQLIDVKCTILDVGYKMTPLRESCVYDADHNPYVPAVYYNGFIIKFLDYPEWRMITRFTHLWGEESYAYRFSSVINHLCDRVSADSETMEHFIETTANGRLPVDEDERFGYVKASLSAAKYMQIRPESISELHQLGITPAHVLIDNTDETWVDSSWCFMTEPNDKLEVIWRTKNS